MLTLTADGCQDVAVLPNTDCCPPPLCGNDLCCTFVAFFNQLPSGPLWDYWKQAAISYFQRSDDPSQCPLLQDPECPSLILHAIYCVLKLKALVHDGLWPAFRESDPLTAVTTLDNWLLQLQWEDCFNQHCRTQLLGEITPYEVMSDCGPLYCPVPFPQELDRALKHNIARSLRRAQVGTIRNLCGLNWIIEPLGTRLTMQNPIQPNPNPPELTADTPCQGFCPDGVMFGLGPFSDYMEGVGDGDVCSVPNPQVKAYWDWGCMQNKPMGLPDEIWPGVLAAECIVRSLLPPTCPSNIIRTDCRRHSANVLIVETAAARDWTDSQILHFANIGETANARDFVQADKVIRYALEEAARADDRLDAELWHFEVKEQANATDTVDAAGVYNAASAVSESVSATDSVDAALVNNARVAEPAAAKDSVDADIRDRRVSEQAFAQDSVSIYVAPIGSNFVTSALCLFDDVVIYVAPKPTL